MPVEVSGQVWTILDINEVGQRTINLFELVLKWFEVGIKGGLYLTLGGGSKNIKTLVCPSY